VTINGDKRTRPSRVRPYGHAVLPWIIPAALIALWQVVGQASGATPGALPTPLLVARAGLRVAASGELLQHSWVSLQRALVGLLIGGGLGLVLGLVNGYFSLAERLLDTPVQMLRNIPHLALIPLVILWFGLGEQSKVFLVALGVLFPLYVNTFHGVRSVDPGLLEMGRLYGLSPVALFLDIILPGALPSILVGLRFALGLMWLSLIVAETIAADAGIGYLAMNAREFMQTDVVILSIAIYALLGKLADVAARALERRWLGWEPRRLRAASPGAVAAAGGGLG
jgi:sulfonate transport system permease protein